MTRRVVIDMAPRARGMHQITAEVIDALGHLPETGWVDILVQHTSAGLTLNENTDPDVALDLMDALDRLAPRGGHRHDAEGPDDMPAHVLATLVGSTVGIPIHGGRLDLGTWQGIYLAEFRDRPRTRRLVCVVRD